MAALRAEDPRMAVSMVHCLKSTASATLNLPLALDAYFARDFRSRTMAYEIENEGRSEVRPRVGVTRSKGRR